MKNKKKLYIIAGSIIVFSLLFLFLYSYNVKFKSYNDLEKQKLEQEQMKKIALDNATMELELLYENDLPRNDISDDDILRVGKLIMNVEDIDKKNELLIRIKDLANYNEFMKEYKVIYVNNLLVNNYGNYYYKFMDLYNKLSTDYKNYYENTIKDINDQKYNIELAIANVDYLFDSEHSSVKKGVTRDQYNYALSLVNNLPQKDISEEYAYYLNTVDVTITKREEETKRREEEARKQKEIDNAWVLLNTPYISQNQNKVYNGCEATSLLMGLKYKGYLKDVDIFKIAEDIPKSTDPHQGFTDSIYDLYPTFPPHWIAPDALAKFGREYSGNQNVIDATGYSFDQILNELKNGNPVVVYLTSKKLKDPVWKGDLEIPSNLHVMLLIGYNPVSNQAMISDPWTRDSSSSRDKYSLSHVRSIYEQVGQKAVVIR